MRKDALLSSNSNGWEPGQRPHLFFLFNYYLNFEWWLVSEDFEHPFRKCVYGGQVILHVGFFFVRYRGTMSRGWDMLRILKYSWTQCQQCSQVQSLNAHKRLWKNFRLMNTKCLFVCFLQTKNT